MESVKLENPVFILGHSRSGTTYLHYLLCKDPQFAFCSVYESLMPWAFLSAGSLLKAIMRKALPETRPMDNVKLKAESPKEEEFALGCMGVESMITGYFFPRIIYDTFRKYVLFDSKTDARKWQNNLMYFMKKLTLKYGPKPLLLKSPANLGRVKEILEIFPQAKFIHIHRDPYTVFKSNERLYEKTLPMMTFQHFDEKHIQHFIKHSYIDTFTKYFKEKKLIPNGNLAEISYEKFVGDEVKYLQEIYRQLGFSGFETALPFFECELQSQKNYQTNRYELTDEEKSEIYENWKMVFDELGYSGE